MWYSRSGAGEIQKLEIGEGKYLFDLSPSIDSCSEGHVFYGKTMRNLLLRQVLIQIQIFSIWYT